jgi:hypothetical protein
MKQLISKSYNKNIKSMESRISNLEAQELQMKYVNDCRAWMEYKPDALYDVEIYQIRENKWKDTGLMGLMCYIPGPEGSVWEGARIPMKLRYGVNFIANGDYTLCHPCHTKPPKCHFM